MKAMLDDILKQCFTKAIESKTLSRSLHKARSLPGRAVPGGSRPHCLLTDATYPSGAAITADDLGCREAAANSHPRQLPWADSDAQLRYGSPTKNEKAPGTIRGHRQADHRPDNRTGTRKGSLILNNPSLIAIRPNGHWMIKDPWRQVGTPWSASRCIHGIITLCLVRQACP